jgi:hypothetical protein
MYSILWDDATAINFVENSSHDSCLPSNFGKSAMLILIGRRWYLDDVVALDWMENLLGDAAAVNADV